MKAYIFPKMKLKSESSGRHVICVVTFSRRVFVVLDQSRQSKICDLADELLGHQNVGRSQVAVNVISLLNEGHAVSHLQRAAESRIRRVPALFPPIDGRTNAQRILALDNVQRVRFGKQRGW